MYYVEESGEKEAANLEAVLIHGLEPEYNIAKPIVSHDVGCLELKQKKWTKYEIPEWLLYGRDEYMSIIIHSIIDYCKAYIKMTDTED